MTMRHRKRSTERITVIRRNSGKRRAKQSNTKRKNEPLRPKEQRQMLQLVICGSIFVLVVAVKLLLPSHMAQINQMLSGAMERNMDVKAVFSAIGGAFSDEKELEDTMKEVYQAVLKPQDVPQPQEIGAVDSNTAGAMEMLRQYRIVEAIQDQRALGEQTEVEALQVSSLAYVLYSDQNLPDCVSMEQAILDFSYRTPVVGELSSGFGYREHPVEGEDRFHYGIDIAADVGTDVVSFADGVVTAVGESSSYGKYCIVRHSDDYFTLYAHCSRITASSGTAVVMGEKIAEVGETGMATGPHLHFELQCSGTYLNPIYYVSTV